MSTSESDFVFLRASGDGDNADMEEGDQFVGVPLRRSTAIRFCGIFEGTSGCVVPVDTTRIILQRIVHSLEYLDTFADVGSAVRDMLAKQDGPPPQFTSIFDNNESDRLEGLVEALSVADLLEISYLRELLQKQIACYLISQPCDLKTLVGEAERRLLSETWRLCLFQTFEETKDDDGDEDDEDDEDEENGEEAGNETNNGAR